MSTRFSFSFYNIFIRIYLVFDCPKIVESTKFFKVGLASLSTCLHFNLSLRVVSISNANSSSSISCNGSLTYLSSTSPSPLTFSYLHPSIYNRCQRSAETAAEIVTDVATPDLWIARTACASLPRLVAL